MKSVWILGLIVAFFCVPADTWAVEAGSPDLNCDGVRNVLDVQIAILGALDVALSPDVDGDGIHDGCAPWSNDVLADDNNNGVLDGCESLPAVADISCGSALQVCGNCPSSPSKCTGGTVGYSVDEVFVPSSGCGSPFALYRDMETENTMTSALGQIVSLMQSNGTSADGLTSLEDLVTGNGLLNRYGDEVSSIPSYSVYVGSFSVGSNTLLDRAFRWGGSSGSSTADFNDGLFDKDFWEVQGVTGTYDAIGTVSENFGTALSPKEKRLLLTSFYHSDELGNGTDFPKGVRVALTDITSLDGVGSDDEPRYRLMLLVSPGFSGNTPTFAPLTYDSGLVSNHAGGLVWYRGENGHDYLYVPDTSTGIRVFDLSQILRVSDVSDKESIGAESGNTYSAYSYQYVVPEVARYRLCGSSCCVRFSSISLDRSTTPHSIVAGEYDSVSDTNRMTRWPLNHKTGLPLHQKEADGGPRDMWVASDTYSTGVSKIQGVLTLDGHAYITTTQTENSGLTFTHAKCFHANFLGGRLRGSVCPSYSEDLYYDGEGIWTCTEKPGNRYCVRFDRDEFSRL